MKILITGAWAASREDLEAIRGMGHEIFFLPQEKDPLPCSYEDIEGCICNGLFLYHPIEKFKSLHYIQLTSAGFDRVPLDYVNAHKIEIHNAHGVYSIPMAEFAISGVLQLYKQSGFFRDNQQKHCWEKHRGLRELFGKTVCIVGCGSVGTECANRFAAFGCEIIGVDIGPVHNPIFKRIELLETLETLLPQVDILILSVPLNNQTNHLINASRITKMKSDAILVNISRGAVIDEKALIEWLEDAPKAGAILDVFESEPLPKTNPLWEKPNVLITPHNSFVGEKNNNRFSSIVITNLIIPKV